MSLRNFCFSWLLLLGLCACGLDKKADTNLPFIEVFTPKAEVTGNVKIRYRIRDRDGRSVNVLPFFPGGRNKTTTLAPGSDSTINKRATSQGAIYDLTWDSLADLGPGLHVNQTFQIVAIGRDGRSYPSSTFPFVVNNSDGQGPVPGGLNTPRNAGLAVQTPDSSVVWALGTDSSGRQLQSTSIFSIALQRFIAGPDLSQFRSAATIARESRGALILGGRGGSKALIAKAEVVRTDLVPARVEFVGPLLVPRAKAKAIELADGRVVVIGGSDGMSNIETVEIYSHGVFRSLVVDPRTALQNHSLVRLASGDILIVGGIDKTGTVSNKLLRLSVNGSAGTITNLGTMNTARSDAGLLRLDDDQILIVGGTANGRDSGALNSVERYLPGASQTQVFGARMKEARIHPALSVTDNVVLISGGRSKGRDSTIPEKFNLKAGQFERIRYPGLARRGRAFGFKFGDGRTMVIGDHQVAEFYFPSSSAKAENFRRALGANFALAGAAFYPSAQFREIICVGGNNGYGPTRDIFVFRVARALSERRGQMLEARLNHAVTNLANPPAAVSLLIIGGRTGTGVTARCEVTDATFGQTKQTGSLKIARENHGALTLANGQILAFGGRDRNGQVLGSVEQYDRNQGTWSIVANFLTPRADFAVFPIPGTGEFLIAGGIDATGKAVNTVEMYNPQTKQFRVVVRLSEGRRGPTLAFGQNDRFLAVCGGRNSKGVLSTAELVDLRAEISIAHVNLRQPRVGGAFSVVRAGQTLLFGGSNGAGTPPPEILFISANGFASSARPTADPLPQVARTDGIVANFGFVTIILGGRDKNGVVLAGAELFQPPKR